MSAAQPALVLIGPMGAGKTSIGRRVAKALGVGFYDSDIDVATGETASAHHQRSDVCAVPAAGVVAEAMVAVVLADVVLEKFGGDSIRETRRNLESYLASIPETLQTTAESDTALAGA